MESGSDDRMVRLQAALAVYQEHADSGPEAIAAALDRHPEIRDLLEPMFAGDADDLAEDPDGQRELDDYRLLREIGRGGMGIVYEACELSLGRTVALKVLTPERELDPGSIVRLHREASAAASLDHPNIVKVHKCGTAGGVHFIAMDLVFGAPLNQVVAHVRDRQPRRADTADLRAAVEELAVQRDSATSTATAPGWPDTYIASVVGIAARVADALSHAHARGVIHRDVKPANILVRPDGSVVLTDFSVARRESQPSLTDTGSVPGTPYYVAPEQVQSWRREVDHRADIFSLGVTLYELLTVQRPFEGRTSQQVMNNIVTADPIDPRRLNPALPADLVAIVMMALEKEPGRRYQSAADLAEDLRAFLTYRTVRARPHGPLTRLRSWARRRPLAALLTAFGLLAVPVATGLVGYFVAIQPELRAGQASLLRESVDQALTSGFLAMEEHDNATARSAFEQALAHDPTCDEAIAGLAIVAGRSHPRAALALLDQHPDRLAATPGLRRFRAALLRAAGDATEADRQEQQLGPIATGLDAFLTGVGEIQLGHREGEPHFRKARTLLSRAVLASQRPRPVYHFEHAHVLGHLGERAGAAEIAAALAELWPNSAAAHFWAAFAQGMSNPAAAARAATRATELAPTRWLFWNNLGFYHQRAGEQAAAREAYGQSLKLRPRNADTWRDLGVVRLRLGDVAGAERALRESTRLDPRQARAWTLLAELMLDAGRNDEAKAAAGQGLAAAPESDEAQRVAGRVRLLFGDAKGAVEALRKAVALLPSSPSYFHLGRALHAFGDRDGSIAAYRAAIRLWPENAEAHTNLANRLLASGDRKRAEQHLRTAIRVKPSLSQPNRVLFGLLNDQSRIRELEAHCAEWRKRIPGDPQAWSQSAWFTLWCGAGTRQQNARDALPFAVHAAELSKHASPRVLHVLGVVQMHSGDPSTAVKSLERAVRLATERGMRARQIDPIRTSLEEARNALPKR
ncbi:MAG: protein kinase [Planctomycetes bacterium]|nr:protein kinase [Planctomycetota bacterium]MCB9869858.1 protein kinase [Planctomycetota bacterium]